MTVPPAVLCHSAYSVVLAAARFFVAAASHLLANLYCYCSSFRACLTICVVDYCRPPVAAVASVSVDDVAAEPFATGSALIADPSPRSLDIR